MNLHAPTGPAPTWVKVAFCMAALVIVLVTGHNCLWRLW